MEETHSSVIAQASFSGEEEFRQAICSDVVSVDPRPYANAPFSLAVTQRSAGGVRALSVRGEALVGVRDRQRLASDANEFVGVIFQREGRTVYEREGKLTVVCAGDIALWHSQREAKFTMPEPYRKLCMVVPAEKFQDFLPNTAAYDGLRIAANSVTGAMLGGWLSAFADRVIEDGSETLGSSIDSTLAVLAATITAHARELDISVKDRQLLAIMRYMESRLADSSLTAATVAQHFGISVRHLERIFAGQRTTVAGWRRLRRLERCRAELSHPLNRKTITTIAIDWGFSDAAHFSRLFKATYGMSPRDFCRSTR
ncbi:helix-turn-helix domain-containing protein [Paraburkholderia solisilvae]|uniref:Transcriptional activator FeaR n=1 Tax=Paraburkholderia solisilvae TaxID=624376 RepID=A0A6J5DK79_9BURK|nr:helix-turn-helix domain-containing protein [Paraburkholderia solisilvae]CAB3754700.1 Transcriptional activator FeaR [Paraburkholderia solisilvae]